MPTFLDQVTERTRADVDARAKVVPVEALEERIEAPGRARPFSEALVAEGISLIAEMKRASPSKGPIRPDATVTQIVQAYEQAGASACSVLTEPAWFGGSLDDLVEARAAVDLPLLRKDFIVTRYQILEAKVAGANAVLLIVAALSPERLVELQEIAASVGLDTLVEVHDEDEMEIAVEAGAEILGVNNRNLHTLDGDPETAPCAHCLDTRGRRTDPPPGSSRPARGGRRIRCGRVTHRRHRGGAGRCGQPHGHHHGRRRRA